MTRIKSDPAALDRQVEQLKAQMVPVFKQQPGYLGVISVGNRETGEGAVTTYWDSMEHLRASEPAIFAARDKFATEQGAEIVSFHRCETLFSERKAAPRTGAHLRAAVLTGVDASKIEALAERHRTHIAPLVMQQPGVLASILLYDREKGIAFAISTYETAAHRDAAAAVVEAKFATLPPGPEGIERTTMTGETTHADLAVPVHST